ncbi:MAG TPA: cold shock domain-containing protein [Rhodanobacter sp.]|nr:cold shock domain-containing protein [Rhodanobacter sp.]
MRTHGTLIKWNDDRGFGFIAPAAASAEIFVHVSAFPRDGVRPRVGELLSFDVEVGKNGRPQAIRVMRAGTAHPPPRSRPQQAARMRRRQGSPASIGGALLFAAVAAYVWISQRHAASTAYDKPAVMTQRQPAATPLFSCDDRTRCSQMTSCAEATYFLDHCPNTMMDGNHDGIPCQSQWCGSAREDWP